MTITSFLRAIRAGAIDVKHSAVLLAHYDRLGSTFDQCSKVVIEVLKEEGMYRKNGAAVAHVVTQALREVGEVHNLATHLADQCPTQSFTLYIDGLADTDASSIALGKALSLAFAARGPHLSIVARLPSQHVVDVHSDAITWIAKRLGQYENSKNKTKRAKAVSFFRVLVQLATFLDGHEASQM